MLFKRHPSIFNKELVDLVTQGNTFSLSDAIKFLTTNR